MHEEFAESLSSFEKARIARIGDAVVPFQTVLQRLPADVARTDEGGAFDQLAVHCLGKDVGLEVKAGRLSFVDPDVAADALQQQEQSQCLRIGDIEVVAGQNTNATVR